MLRRAKLYLALRTVEDFEELLGLDWRREWNKKNPNRLVETMLDLFPSLKFAYESMLPLTARLRKHGIAPDSIDWRNSPWYSQALRNATEEKESLFCDAAQVVKSPEVPTAKDLFCDEYVDIVASEKNGNETIRMEDVCRSHSIWLDPIDASLELYKWKLRIQEDSFKNSKIPFDLLREVTAANIDLWCEYAIATKGMAALRISRPLAKKINEYFDAHPDKNPIPKDLPPSKVVAHLEATIYRLFYRNFLIPQLKAKAAEGFEAIRYLL